MIYIAATETVKVIKFQERFFGHGNLNRKYLQQRIADLFPVGLESRSENLEKVLISVTKNFNNGSGTNFSESTCQNAFSRFN